MRQARAFEQEEGSRLFARRSEDRIEWWTETVGHPPGVYGERWASLGTRTLRAFDPTRSKLAAGLARGWEGRLPRPKETWLYLGAASGTTASHVADLVGPDGTVFAVEKSPRPFARLLGVTERWPNLLPILGDAREPEMYSDLVPVVDGIYADVSQADQTGLLLRHAELFLDPRAGAFLMALKTPSMGRERGASGHLRAAEEKLGERFQLDVPVKLDPFHRGHFLLGGEIGEPAPRATRPVERSRPDAGGRSDPTGAWELRSGRRRAPRPERRRR